MDVSAYDRNAAMEYAHKWSGARNPEYYNYDKIGGDCTNFVSQCIYQGSGVMDFTPEKGWYYRDANNKSPSWTGVEFLWRFLTGNAGGTGPYGIETWSGGVEPGDVVQLKFDKNGFSHSLIVVEIGPRAGASGIIIAAHSMDCDYRPLDTYIYEAARFLHIVRVGGTGK